MMLFNFIKFDLYNGIVRQRKKIVVVCIAYILINLVYANLTYTFIKNGMIPSAKELNIGDYIAYYLFGISEYIPDKNNPFPFPFLWMFQILGCCFFCLHYPLEDLYECGKQRLILCGNRMIWWVSKSVWLFSNIILYYIIAYFSSMIVAVIFGANISSSIRHFKILRLGKRSNCVEKPMCLKQHIIQGILIRGNTMQNRIFMVWSGVKRLWK